MLQMIKVNDYKDLVDVLSSLDCEEYIQIQIGTNEIELFYDSTTDKFTMFDKCDIDFDTLDEMESYLQFWYLY